MFTKLDAFHLQIKFAAQPTDSVIASLKNLLGTKMSVDSNVYTFETAKPIDYAKVALHRAGYQRFDEVYINEEEAIDQFGWWGSRPS